MRRASVGFETGSNLPGLEYSGYDNLATGGSGDIIEAPAGRGGLAFHSPPGVSTDGFIRFIQTAGNGPYFGRAYFYLPSYPIGDEGDVMFFAEAGVATRVGLSMRPSGRLFLHEGAPSFAQVGPESEVLALNAWHCVEIGYTNNPVAGTSKVEARVNGVVFANSDVAGSAGPVNMFDWGNIGGLVGLDLYVDDVAVNDGSGTDENSWCGEGHLVAWTTSGDDVLGNTGWLRGGTDTGADWRQVTRDVTTWDAESQSWDTLDVLWSDVDDDDDTWLNGNSNGVSVDFRITNPYDLGIQEGDTIKVVTAQVRWQCVDNTGASAIQLYLRAGSNLDKATADLTLNNVDWHTGNDGDTLNDSIALSRLPLWTERWTTADLAGIRVGVTTVDTTPHLRVSIIWGYIEYKRNDTPDYQVLINGVNRAADVDAQSLTIDDIVNEQANTISFGLYDLHGYGSPSDGDRLQVLVNNVPYFSGYITEAKFVQIGPDRDIYAVEGIDHTRDLDRRRVAATYTNLTDKEIIERMASEFASDDYITTYHVGEGATISSISFNYLTFTQAMKKICERTGRNWFIDYNKDIHYFPITQDKAPFDISDGTITAQRGLQLTKNGTNIRNRVFVRGGTELSSSFTETQKADGSQRQFLLAEKPHNLTMTLNGVAQTVGIKNIDDPATFDFLMNFEQKYMECGTLTTTPVAGDSLAFTYKYDVPVLVSVEDSASIAEQAALSGGSGVFEHVITDQNISTTQEARDRATAELSDYARSQIDGQFMTMASGFRSGQYMHITQATKGVDDDYLINRVRLSSLGAGLFETQVQLTSAKMIGIVTFLIKLLTQSKADESFNASEVVDQLLSVRDNIDSITDLLTDSMGGTAAKWSNDPGSTTNKLKWDLGQWQ